MAGIQDPESRGTMIFAWWMTCLSDAYASAYYRRKPVLDDEDYDIDFYTVDPVPDMTDSSPSPREQLEVSQRRFIFIKAVRLTALNFDVFLGLVLGTMFPISVNCPLDATNSRFITLPLFRLNRDTIGPPMHWHVLRVRCHVSCGDQLLIPTVFRTKVYASLRMHSLSGGMSTSTLLVCRATSRAHGISSQ